MSELFDSIEVTEDVKRFVDHSFAVVDQIDSLLKAKGMTRRQLATELGKSESEISKWMTGRHNFTLKSLSKIEAVLDADIVTTPMKARVAYKELVCVSISKQVTIEKSFGKFTSAPYEVFRGGLKSA